MAGSVLSVSSRAMLEACARLGLDTTQILQAAKLDRKTLQDPEARIPVEQADALWKKACHVLRFQDGKLVSFQQYLDTAQLQRVIPTAT